MIEPDRYASLLRKVSTVVETEGPLAWARVDDWESANMPLPFEPDADEDEERRRAGRSVEDDEDRRDDAAAARYRSELSKLLQRSCADLARIETIIGVCNPPCPKSPKNRDLMAAQVSADGYCVSCWRAGGMVEKAKGRYKDLCRNCGEFKASEGVVPPVSLAAKALAYGWRKITAGDVSKALGKAS